VTNETTPIHERLTVQDDEWQAIVNDIKRRNLMRKKAKLPVLDPDALIEAKVHTLVERKYRAFLEPHLRKAFAEIDGHPGLAGRLLQTIRIWKQAEAELLAETGIANPLPKPPDMMVVMSRYINGSLAERGVS